MNNISSEFEDIFVPFKALLVYESTGRNNDTYVEAYDIDKNGFPINAHPLSKRESISLARSLASSKDFNCTFLQCKGLMPQNVLYMDIGLSGYAIWHTPPQKKFLHFSEFLSIKSGEANVPALLWKANRNSLQVFALKGIKRPDKDTALYNAPFFNINMGSVCMGTVKIDIPPNCSLEDFIQKWEYYFFNSFFTHSLGNVAPAKVNVLQLWNTLITEGGMFPEENLLKSNRTLKNLLQ